MQPDHATSPDSASPDSTSPDSTSPDSTSPDSTSPDSTGAPIRPLKIDLKKTESLTIAWSDGRVSVYSIAFLRKHSPSADAREQRKEMAANPLTVLPASSGGPLTATDAELVGRYAIKLSFSDGHHTGLYTWEYLHGLEE